MLQLGRGLLHSWSDVAEARVAPPTCESCEERMRHKGYVASPLLATLGSVRVRRVRFRCEQCGADCHPHDARLRFLNHGVSWSLAKVIGRLGAQLPLEQARQNLKTDYGVHVSKHLVEQVCEGAGCAVIEREDAARCRLQQLPRAELFHELPDGPFSPEKACLYADGAMLHTAAEWYEIRVRSASSFDAEGKLLYREDRARFLSCDEFGWQLFLLARRVGYHRALLRAFLADGAR